MSAEVSSHELTDGSRVAVVGGGPAGSLVGYFLMRMARRAELDLAVDIYEPRDFSRTGPAGCNMCGGIVSESLVQLLAVEGILLPDTVVRRGIESYVLHTDAGSAAIRSPVEERRIAALYRGGGPKGATVGTWGSFDAFLLGLACQEGCRHIPARVTGLEWAADRRPTVQTADGRGGTYELLIGAVGVNSPALGLFRDLGIGLEPPKTSKTFIAEIPLGQEAVEKHLGAAMHAFLLDLPRLQFAALIPKGDYVTVCALGRDLDLETMTRFMASAPVRACLPGTWDLAALACRCGPKINIGRQGALYGDRVVMIGDCGVSRLYKDGIGAAYRAAKACAVAAFCRGVSRQDFAKSYAPRCRKMVFDNTLGKLMFGCSAVVTKTPFLQNAMLSMTRAEQASGSARTDMSMILWDLFTGSAPYAGILARAATPRFLGTFAWHAAKSLLRHPRRVCRQNGSV
jgi:flavin-dependent dehydrogenase